jgi:hypothetical protein
MKGIHSKKALEDTFKKELRDMKAFSQKRIQKHDQTYAKSA